ncbi:MAG: hypothetical protein U0802_02770 [Candidatus Binatia bacterium]
MSAQPGVALVAAAALIGEAVAGEAELLGDQRRADAKLVLIGEAAAMATGMLCAVNTSCTPAAPRRQCGERAAGPIGDGIDEQGMGVPVGGEVDRGRGAGQRCASLSDVALVPTPPGVVLLRGEDDADGAAPAGAVHRRQRVGQVGVPVAHPDMDRHGGQRSPAAPATAAARRLVSSVSGERPPISS